MTNVPPRISDPLHASRGALATDQFPLGQAMPAARRIPLRELRT